MLKVLNEEILFASKDEERRAIKIQTIKVERPQFLKGNFVMPNAYKSFVIDEDDDKNAVWVAVQGIWSTHAMAVSRAIEFMNTPDG